MSDGSEPPAPANVDSWSRLRALSPARVGLGRVGTAPPLDAVLDFQAAHADARDAVNVPLDVAALTAALGSLPVITVASAAPDRPTYLRRPDLGRMLDPASAAALPGGPGYDLVFVVGDGLSARAVQRHAAPQIHACIAALPEFSVAPVVVASQARVAIGDPIGAALGARMAIVLIGERPGLTVSDSLGIYLTYDPRPGRSDSERNCISNIHDNGGLSYAGAARTLAWLVREGFRRSLTGVALKDDQSAATDQLPDMTADQPTLP